MPVVNATHDPRRRSWVDTANRPDADFPIQNLPFGVFRRDGEVARGGVAIGDKILDLTAAAEAGLLDGAALEAARAASGPALNPLMALGLGPASALRAQLSDLLSTDGARRGQAERLAGDLLAPMAGVELLLPARIDAFTDMMVSSFHVSGGRHGEPLHDPPGNFKHVPLGYNSRASTVVVSGASFARPHGVFPDEAGRPTFGPEPQQDFELEVGAFVAGGNAMGRRISIDRASDQIFGYCLLNDWSARGIQFFEMAPLGPFLGKSFCTTISPWVITAEALAPFAIPAFARPTGDPRPLPHLMGATDQQAGGLDIDLEALLLTPRMRDEGQPPARVTRTNFRHMYWTFAQIITHHASNGCNLRPGDLVASGTTSGPTDETCGCLLEQTVSGAKPLTLPNGETRRFLDDGDEVIFRGRAQRDGYVPIGFGEARGRLAPAMVGED